MFETHSYIRTRGRALVQAGMRDGRLRFPTSGLPLFEFWFKFPFQSFSPLPNLKDVANPDEVPDDTVSFFNLSLLLSGKKSATRGIQRPHTRQVMFPTKFPAIGVAFLTDLTGNANPDEGTIGHPRAVRGDGRLPVALTTNMEGWAAGLEIVHGRQTFA
ncbi:hypothetical protein B0H14DRAFT_2569350 [Mycena olivaceomarginata]|nr:hypothetical protein B0H14DRAFT_2569350 [Mycena olivaceomarginata]